MKYKLAELVDLEQLQRLMVATERMTGVSQALVGSDGTVLVSAGWQPLCSRFAVAGGEPCPRCGGDGAETLKWVTEGDYVGYRCPHGLMDYGMPVVIAGEHLANLFAGQLLHEPPDPEFFRRQARVLGFDETAYLKALQSVPVVPRERIESIMTFEAELARTLAGSGESRLRQLEVEDELRETSAMLQGAMDQSEVGIAIADAPDGRLQYINDAGLFTRRSSEEKVRAEVEGENYVEVISNWQFLHLDGTPFSDDEAPWVRAVRHREKCTKEFILRRSNAEDHVVWANAAPILDDSGKVTASIAVLVDITERKRAEEELRRAYAYNRSLIEATLDPLATIGPEGRITDVNRATELITGQSRQALIGQEFIGLFTDPEKARSVYERVFRNEAVRDYALELRHQDGHVTPVLYNASTYRNEAGEIIGVVAAARDISERLRAETELQTLNQQLEQRVRERTRELEAARHQALSMMQDAEAARARSEDALRQLRESTQRLRVLSSAIEQSPSLVVITDVEGRIEYVNPRFQEATGYSAQEVLGKNPRLLNAGILPASVFENLWRTILSGRSWHGELCNRKKSGEMFWETVSISPVRGEDGRINQFVAVEEDITEKRAQAEALRLAKEAADAANRAKSDFLANMSHEIRTPMNAIIGLSELCLRTDLDDKQRDYVRKVYRSARTLLGIINDILDFSKIEAGKLMLESTSFDLLASLEDLDSVIGELAREKGLHFETRVADDVPRYLIGDSLRLGQVLLNLASNAVKFTKEGAVIVSVALKASDEANVELECSVRDTGIGLTPAQLGRLFHSFSQADTSTTRKFGGTGLGLAISKRLAEMMGGKIWVKSVPGEGSDFRFTVRLGRGETVAAESGVREGELAAARERINGARILLAEDNLFNQQVAIEQIEGAGAMVAVANDGREALDMLDQVLFDVVLMDVQMPEMDGYEATRRIRTTPTLAGLPVIAMTANAMTEDRQRCLAAGMDDFIAKPIDPDQLYLTLAKWLPQRRKDGFLPAAARAVEARPAPPPDPAPQPAAGAESVIDLAVLGRMVKNDTAKVCKFAGKFVEATRETLAEVAAAHSRRDLAALGALGHKMKSSARTVGAESFADLCQSLEMAGRAGDWVQAETVLPRLAPLFERIVAQVERELGGAT